MAADRLDGWKSIAAYLNRDRTTVIRWTRERGLPVHRLPGGRTGTVFALRSELDRWVGLTDLSMPPLLETAIEPAPNAATDVLQQDTPSDFANRPNRRRRFTVALAAAGLSIAAVAIGVPKWRAAQSPTLADPVPVGASEMALPADPAIASNFLLARDLVADRKAAGLERAIGLLEAVVRADPDYAPGHAALAEALLLSREFGMRSDAEAFAAARVAVRSSIRLAPDLAIGHRLLGFLAYWADRDFAEADAQFRRAIMLNPDDAHTHFWYGNILSDHGDHAAGLRALNRARLLQPGSVAIGTDLAWAQWANGQDAVAKTALDGILAEHPDFAVAHDCRAIIALSEGDYAGYARNFARFAALKQDARLIENARAVAAALQRGTTAGRAEIMRQALADTRQDRTHSYAWPALIASAGGDRAELSAMLLAADRRGERWEEAGLAFHIGRAWRHDPQILAALARVTPNTPAIAG